MPIVAAMLEAGDTELVARLRGAISKLAAWREKDQDFVSVLIRRGLVSLDEIRARLDEIDEETATRIRARLRGLL